MKQLTLEKVNKLGEMDAKFGQTYWAETKEQLEPVMFNSMNENIVEGSTIEAEEVLLKQSKKGTDYHRLKKVKVVSGATPQPASSPDQGELLALVRANNAMLRKLIGEPEVEKVVEPTKQEMDGDIDLSSIPF